MAAARQVLRHRVRTARAAPARRRSAPGPSTNLGRAEADHVLHVQRSGLPLRRRVLSQRHDLRAGGARTGRRGARPDQAAARRARRRAARARALARLDPELQLLHHQADEDRSAAGPAQRHPAGPLCFPGAFGQDHSRRHPDRARRRRAPCNPPTRSRARTPTRASEILFAGADGEEKTLYYFTTDLSNGGVKVSAAF